MSHRTVTPAKPIAVYTRVSEQGRRSNEELHSHDLQRAKVAQYLKVKGLPTSRKTWRENNVSGGKVARPVLNSIIEGIENGTLGGIAVAYLDRFARTLTGALTLMERIEKAGGVVIALDADFDTSTAMGKAMMRMALVMGAFYREQGIEKATDLVAVKREQGLTTGGRPAVGYEWEVLGQDSKGKNLLGWLVPGPHFEVVKEARLGFASGRFVTAGQVADFLNEHGVTTSKGNVWNHRTIVGFLKNHTFAGVAAGNRQHEAMHDLGIQRVIERKLAPKNTGTRQRGEGHLLGQGLVRCGKCGKGMTKGGAHKTYLTMRCNERGSGHASITYSLAEDFIVGRAFVHGVEFDGYFEGVSALRSREALVQRVAEAGAEVERIEAEIGTTLPESSVQRKALAIAEDALYTFDAEHEEAGFGPIMNRADFEKLPTMAEKIKALRALITRVVVEPSAEPGVRSPDVAGRISIEFTNGNTYPHIPARTPLTVVKGRAGAKKQAGARKAKSA